MPLLTPAPAQERLTAAPSGLAPHRLAENVGNFRELHARRRSAALRGQMESVVLNGRLFRARHANDACHAFDLLFAAGCFVDGARVAVLHHAG
jgi:hypothetical protein